MTDDREVHPADQLVDWPLATRTAQRLSAAGPSVSAAQAAELVADLRAAAQAAGPPIAQHTQLSTAPSTEPGSLLVVDRAGWVAANVAALRATIGPAAQAWTEPRRGAVFSRVSPPAGGLARSLARQAAGAQLGGLLSFMASRVLGQYDIAPGHSPRLLLVAPNILQVQRKLDLPAADFQLWVCLHEETHRVQFTAIGWLREYLLGEISRLVASLGPEKFAISQSFSHLGRQKDAPPQGQGLGLAGLVASSAQRDRLHRLTAVMSLLEGHAEVMMDAVGPELVPSVELIRERFTKHRESADPLRRVLRQVLGLDAKMQQYLQGSKFVRRAIAEVGVAGFNRIWTSPNTLPTPAEIADPAIWLRRIHGG